jgi:hypothetical protein
MTNLRQTISLLAIVALVAACGGGGASNPTDTAPSSGPTQPGASTGASDGAPTDDPAATPGDTGVGGASGVCSLVTAQELDSTIGVTGHTTQVIPGPPDTCDIQLDGAFAAAFVYTPVGGRMIFDLLAGGDDAEAVDGVGDDAFYSSDTLLLVIAKGDGMLSIAVEDEGRTEEARLELMKEIGAIAAGRM